MKIFLDLDGVICEFVYGAAKVFNVDYEELLARWPRGTYEMEKALGVTTDQFFDKLEQAGISFWADLPFYHYAKDFYNHCISICPTFILTSPTRDPNSLAGKMVWLQKWFGKKFRDYILTPRKEMCASPTHILIDDHEFNCERFIACGGNAILWPTLFNKRYNEAADPVTVVKQELDSLGKKIVGGCQSEGCAE